MNTHYRARALVALIAVAASVAIALPRAASAQQKWDEVVAAAKKEGELVIKGAPGQIYNEVFAEAFKKKYPDIKVSYTGLHGFESIPRITREREERERRASLAGAVRLHRGHSPPGALRPGPTLLRRDGRAASRLLAAACHALPPPEDLGRPGKHAAPAR